MALKKAFIYIDKKDKTDTIESLAIDDTSGMYSITFKNSPKVYKYSAARIQIKRSGVESKQSQNLFSYLQQLVKITGQNLENDSNILEKIYAGIEFIPKESILSNYLNEKLPAKIKKRQGIDLYPFGFNLSQHAAVNTAFGQSLSIIEGPPGTGKTQTILNIIAQAVMQGKSIAIVSNSNAATKNVYDKLAKNGLGFIVALLGNSDNKKNFIDSQQDIPELSSYALTAESLADFQTKSTQLYQDILNNLGFKNELALVLKEIDEIKTEYTHFQNTTTLQNIPRIKFTIPAYKILNLWFLLEKLSKKSKTLKWWDKVWYRLKYKIIDNKFFTLDYKDSIAMCIEI